MNRRLKFTLICVPLIILDLFFILIFSNSRYVLMATLISLFGLLTLFWNTVIRNRPPTNENVLFSNRSDLSFDDINNVTIKKLSDNIKIKFDEGKLFYDKCDYQNAILKFNEAIEDANEKHRNNLQSLQDNKNSSSISADLLFLLEAKNEYVIYYYKGLCYFCTKNYDLAINDWEQVIALKPEFESELKYQIRDAKDNLKKLTKNL